MDQNTIFMTRSKLPPSERGDQAPSRAKKWRCWGSSPAPVIPEDSERMGSDLVVTTSTTFHLSAGSFHVSTASLGAPPAEGASQLPAESHPALEVHSLASPKVVSIGVRFIANNRLQQMHDNLGSSYLQVEQQLPRRPAPSPAASRLARLTPTAGDISPLTTERSAGHANASARTSGCGSMISNASPAASAEAHRAALLDGYADEAAAFVFGGIGGRPESPDPCFLLGSAHLELEKLSPVAQLAWQRQNSHRAVRGQ